MKQNILIIIDEKKFRNQNGMIYTAIKEIDLNSSFSLEKFFHRMVELRVLRILPLSMFAHEELMYIEEDFNDRLKDNPENKVIQSIVKKSCNALGWK